MSLTPEQIKSLFNGETLDIDGFEVALTTEQDVCMGEPWKEMDGNGIITEWVSRPKHSGERLLSSDRGFFRYYDIAGTIKKATEEGWGLSKEESEGLTRKQIVAKSVDKNFERMKAWCNNDWHYVLFTVKVLFDGVKMGSMSSGGIESDYMEDYEEVVQDCFETAINEAKVKFSEKVKLWNEQAKSLNAM